jgi:hypothetical protein
MSKNTNEVDTLNEDNQDLTERRRTIGIWIILVWAVWGLFSLITIWKSILVPRTDIEIQQTKQLFGTDFPLIQLDIGFGVLVTVGSVIFVLAAWDLFMLRSRAIKLFAVCLGLVPVNIVYSLIMIPNYLSLLKTPTGWGGLLFGLGIYIAFILYAVRLRRRGVLL